MVTTNHWPSHWLTVLQQVLACFTSDRIVKVTINIESRFTRTTFSLQRTEIVFCL